MIAILAGRSKRRENAIFNRYSGSKSWAERTRPMIARYLANFGDEVMSIRLVL